MTNQCNYTVESDSTEGQKRQDAVEKTGLVSFFLCRISQFWPVSFTMRTLRGVCWLFGFSAPVKAVSPAAGETEGSPKSRPCRPVRKRLHRATRLLLAFLPRRIQSALGYPVCTSIGRDVSPELRCSPNKASGQGSKRKQDDLDEEDEVEEQSWMQALDQELNEEDHAADPDYEPSAVETDSEEYHSHNDTESDLEIEKGVVVIRDVETVASPDSR